MLLAIDAGNTTVKIGYHDGLAWQAQQRINLPDFIQNPTCFVQTPADQIIIANVAGTRFQSALELALPNQTMHWVQATAQSCGVYNQYQDPMQLGADRWGMLIAARAMFQQTCIVASLGTALTVDVLTAEGVFQGGCIAPGAKLMRTALMQGTHAVQSGLGQVAAYPTNTADAIETGVIYALVGVIHNMIASVEASAQGPLQLILTGGDAHLLVPHLSRDVQLVDNLVLEGLIVLAREENNR